MENKLTCITLYGIHTLSNKKFTNIGSSSALGGSYSFSSNGIWFDGGSACSGFVMTIFGAGSVCVGTYSTPGYGCSSASSCSNILYLVSVRYGVSFGWSFICNCWLILLVFLVFLLPFIKMGLKGCIFKFNYDLHCVIFFAL